MITRDMSFSSYWRAVFILLMSLALVSGVLAPPGRAQADPECADPVPLDEVRAGVTGEGLTVESGTTAEPFSAEVLGVLDDGIAPGLDMILADLGSEAIEEAGVWAGMSGSPVYTEDGRLLGAVSYGLAVGPSSIAGLTPAEAMFDLYSFPGGSAGVEMADEVSLPAALQRRVTAESDATARQARQGMAPLPLPVAVSGVRRQRFDDLEQRLGPDLNIVPFAADRADASAAPPGEIFPGSNFAAALSYGDVTFGGVGTTTDVCNGTALAYGHPAFWEGSTTLSAHTADAIVIQPDLVTSFKVANIGGVAGTVDQDRLAGIRAPLGDGPDSTVLRSRLRSTTTDRERTGRTWINVQRWVPDIAFEHMLANADRVIDALVVPGRAQLTWTAEGTRADGRPWKIIRSNRFADRSDVAFASVLEMSEWLAVIQGNRFADVTFDRIEVTGSVSETFQQLRLGTVRVAVNNGGYRKISAIDRLRVDAGDTIRVRVPLIKHKQETPDRTVNLRLTVPQRLAGQSMRLGVFGGANVSGEIDVTAGASFNDMLARMRGQASNNDVIARLQVAGDEGPEVLRKTERSINQVVSGRRTVPVTVR